MSQATQFIRRLASTFWTRRESAPPTPLLAHWDRAAARPGPLAFTNLSYAADELKIEHFWQAPVFHDRTEHLYAAFELSPEVGYVMEFGVYRGKTINRLAQWASGRSDPRVFGFDSFQGLPHSWVRTKSGKSYGARHFALDGLPAVLDNVELVPGFFDRSISPWLAEHNGPISFLHNDSDLYSSTLTTLRALNKRIRPGMIIVFDELCDWQGQGAYDNWEEGEWKALREWMSQFDRRIVVLSRHTDTSAAIQIAK